MATQAAAGFFAIEALVLELPLTTGIMFGSRQNQNEEREMKRFMLLHFGFEKPTLEVMAAWGEWFKSVADKTVDNGRSHGGAQEISHQGAKDLPMGMESISGYTIINAESLEEAENMARDNPFIASIRVYEIMTQ